MGELGQQTVDFSMLVARAAEKSYLALKELVENSRGFDLSDSDKKIGILKYIVKTQQRMLRLNVLAKWCQQVPLIQYTRQLGSTLSSHDTCFSQAADSLFFMHESLQLARAPIYDVPSAIEVLLTGNYQRLPKCIEEVGVQSTLTKDQQTPALKKLDTLVRSKLLEVSIPKDITEIKVSDGTALLRVNGEFKVLVTLGYRGNMSLWRILHLELLVGERGKPVLLEESRRHALGDDIERRMAATDHPFMILYSVLHELCVGLVMDTVIWQVQALRRGRWKDAIRFELISDGSVGLGGNTGSTQSAQEGDTDAAGLKTPGLKILYWLDFDKSPSNPDRRSCPFIKIEPGQDLRIKCIHSTFVIDPVTGKEAEISIDQSSIDVEKLLLHAICCNRYTRLLEVFKDLEKNGQINQASGDLDLKLQTAEVDSNCGKEYTFDDVKYVGLLMVRAYGSSFFSLGINMRNGLFLLRSSKNVLSPSEVAECEESLNLRTITAAEAFISLRRKSILHLFACFARFLGLEVFEHGFATLKVPMSISNGLSMLLMAFPDCGGSYYLLMQLDKDFRPLFKLLETQADPSGDAAHSFTDPSDVVCLKTVDIVQMQICEDDLNLSLHDCGKLLSSLPRNDINQSSEEFVLEGSALNSNIRSNFSSIVDEVFELEKGSSVPSFSVLAPNSTFGASPVSQLGAGVVDHQNSNVGILSPNCERGVDTNSASRAYNMLSNFNMSVYGAGNYNGLLQSGSPCSTSSRHGPYNIVGEHQLTATGVPAIRHMSSPQSGTPAFGSSGPRDGGVVSGNPRVPVYNSLVASSAASYPDSTVHVNSSMDTNVRLDKISKKRTVSELFNALPSLQYLELNEGSQKRKKITGKNNQQLSFSMLMISEFTRKAGRFCYADLIAEANKGNAPSGIYVSALFHVFRHCSLAIKQARLTSQMEALDIPYVEEVGLRSVPSSLWFVIPFARGNTWQHMCLRLGRPGSMYWDVKICDQHFRDLWELQKGIRETPWGSGVRIADTSDLDSHVHYDSEGVVLSYYSVEADSIKKLVSDIQRLSNARTFAQGMRKLLGVRADGKFEEGITSSDQKPPGGAKVVPETVDKFSEQVRRAFKIEAVGFLSLWFSFGPGVLARFVVEWESSKDGCTIHVSPDQLWPHTKFLEDFINGGEVVSLLDCIRLTAGPLHALAAATRPARASPIPLSPLTILPSVSIQSGYITTNPNINANHSSSGPGAGGSTSAGSGTHSAQNHLTTAMMAVAAAAATGRGVSGIVPTPLLPIDVSVVLRGPYWIRIIYRKDFAVDMRCYAGDQVWLQPATPPKGGPSAGGSLPCPQFRPFIMEHVAQELNGLDIGFTGGQQIGLTNVNSTSTQFSAANVSRNLSNTSGMSRTANPAAVNRVVNAIQPTSNFVAVNSGMPIRRSHGSGVPAHVRGELNTAIIGLGDDGGYGGGWVPLVALKKVLRGTLKYLGVLWLFGQLPDLLKEILGSILKDNEGALLNLDQEQPALRFFVGGYVFAVSVHRVQLLLQVISIKRFHQAQQQQNNSAPTAHEELSPSEIGEICDYFSRRVASEPYDVSRVASFITLLTLPIPVLREFLKLIAWKKGLLLLLLAQQSQSGVGDGSPPQKARIELCLEDHDGKTETLSTSKSNIHYNRSHNAVDFGLSVALDPTHIPHLNPAGGAAWLPYCVSVRLRYSFGENCVVSFLGMEGSHGGRACWIRVDDWEKCKQRVARTVEMNSGGDINLGRLRVAADNVQRTLHSCLQGLKDEGIGTT